MDHLTVRRVQVFLMRRILDMMYREEYFKAREMLRYLCTIIEEEEDDEA